LFIKYVSEKTLRQYKRKEKNLFVAKAIEANGMASIAGENRDQGSISSHETALAGCWRPRKQKVFFFFLLIRTQKILTEDEKGSKVIKRKYYVL
jgi:hypothetical protein